MVYAQGIEITDPTLLRTASGIAPYLVDPSLTHPTSAALKIMNRKLL